ncbi:peptidoglycan editing factor PgeF [Brevibacterium sp. JNUCC-42]|nr:peptidoglycan editing factor PgeF [Brevibacterium sp. JNUCC-42]
MEPFQLNDTTRTLHLKKWESAYPGLTAGFTTRWGKESTASSQTCNLGLHVGDNPNHVINNRQGLADQQGFLFETWTCADQIHGNKVTKITAGQIGAGRDSLESVVADTDGLYTTERGVFLTSFYADCVPLFFLDPISKAIGLAHAGWKGTVSLIAREMVEAFSREYQSNPEDIYVAIGPSIGSCCYEVDERVMQQVRMATSKWEQAVQTSSTSGHFMLDLRHLNQLIVEEAGVLASHISTTHYCTSCRNDLFFSHRKDQGKTGRMASFIGWKEQTP